MPAYHENAQDELNTPDDLAGPRKKGLRRFIEVIARDYGNLFKLNLLCLLCILPSAALFILYFFTGRGGALTALLALAAAFPVGGACCACVFCISKMLRDDPGYISYDFWRKFRENMGKAAVPGLLYAAFIYIQVFLWAAYLSGGADFGAGWILPSLASLLVFGMIAPCLFLQIAYIDIPLLQLLRNSVLIAFSHVLRSVAGGLSGCVLWAAAVLFLPASLVFVPILLLLGFSFSWLLCLFWIWPVIDKTFSIDATLREK